MSQLSFVFVTDPHIGCSGKVRTGDVVSDILKKFEFIKDYCNKTNSILLIGGDIFDKPCVPDYIKTLFIKHFITGYNNPIYTIPGNHCRLYDNPELSYKTSYNLFVEAGVFQELENSEGVDFGSCYLSARLPVIDRGKPQVVIYHGFLNQQDGRNTITYQDIQSLKNDTVICLGHDHCVYPTVSFGDNCRIFRPGSLLRGIRADEQFRQPTLLHITLDESTSKFNIVSVPIQCRDANEIFTEKEAKVSNKDKEVTYDVVIEQIKNAQQSEISFHDALKQVSSPEVYAYLLSLQEQQQAESINKKQNL